MPLSSFAKDILSPVAVSGREIQFLLPPLEASFFPVSNGALGALDFFFGVVPSVLGKRLLAPREAAQSQRFIGAGKCVQVVRGVQQCPRFVVGQVRK
jgi:hypothetical protein